ncbi:ATP-binding protein [Parabacteroides massiliensis]|uniref:ATP-binding protein n=1 Tax=Parabacteroides massiliensis TaxID=1750560 RepID=UPI00096A8C0A|nr:AAA family ATPase [Parabacteroides massiliensis]
MLKRKIINELLYWKRKTTNKALLIKGARQVGKTTIVRQFAKANYKHFIEINFEQMPTAKQAFDGNLDARTILINLSAMGYGPLEPGETLIFFDEIQSCPKARTAIKFLVEDGQYDYIESGSLLGINYKDVSSYPVGFEHELDMYPLDFEEFLWACHIGEDVIGMLEDCYENLRPVPAFLHQQIMERYRQYLIVGGMPEVVATYLANEDFNKTVTNQKDILTGYRNDISKYAGNDKMLVKSVFDAIPGQLSKQDKRFVLAAIEKNASRRKYGAPTQWLVDAGMAYYSFNVGSFELPFPSHENLKLYKLFFVDSGLMCAMMLDKIQVKVLTGDIFVNEGALAENYVAGELAKHGISLNYYDRKSKHELDFVFPEGNKISIIEVKSGKDYKKHSSLDMAQSLFGDRINRRIVMSGNDLEFENGILYLPLYMSMFIK